MLIPLCLPFPLSLHSPTLACTPTPCDLIHRAFCKWGQGERGHWLAESFLAREVPWGGEGLQGRAWIPDLSLVPH